MTMFRRLLGWWRARQRRIDLQILWPECQKAAPDLFHAQGAFLLHTAMDPAWSGFGDDDVLNVLDDEPVMARLIPGGQDA